MTTTQPLIPRLCIIGVGLIGGSLARALRVLSPDELKEALKAERDRRIKDYTSGTILPSTEGAANPAPSAPEEAVKPAPNGTVYRATPESPATGGSGADKSQPSMPCNKTDFDNLPSGAYFINPSDGRVLLKK